ncbi:MAG TPA: hypothetical protein VF094_02160 [Gaiellaceae bacterium]
MVEVLAAAGGVGADGLEVPVAERADPDVLPRRRDRERADPVELAAVGEPVSPVVEVREAATAAPAGEAGLGAVDPAEAGG